MVRKLPEAEFGPEIGIREYSFLDNPRLPTKVNIFYFAVDCLLKSLVLFKASHFRLENFHGSLLLWLLFLSDFLFLFFSISLLLNAFSWWWCFIGEEVGAEGQAL